MGPFLVKVKATIWWNNPPSCALNPGNVTLTVTGYWP
jgi:hypothetical protein